MWFRLHETVPVWGPLWNNYGPKDTAKILHTFGFCVRDNPLNAVKELVLGSRGCIICGYCE